MPKGFKSAGVAAGIKKNEDRDVGLLYSEAPAACAGVFTKNRIQAACVTLDRRRISTSGTCRAIIANSGNANCCTGATEMADALEMGKSAADALGIDEDQVLVASTGVIGQRLPVDRFETAAPVLANELSENGFEDFARAIMTTDTVPKVVTRHGRIDGVDYTVTAVAKGAGMIRPDMATMLCFVCTDIGIGQSDLQAIVTRANDRSFNRITIDGDTSTNDTLLVLANGMSGAYASSAGHLAAFGAVLEEVLATLAKMVVKDGEGATKLVAVTVVNAASDADARKIADTVANSSLVKTAFFGEDANWGRIIAAMGRAGVDFDYGMVDLYFNDVKLLENGIYAGPAAEEAASAVLKQPEFSVVLDLKTGGGEAVVWTCDLSIDYVKINADYRS